MREETTTTTTWPTVPQGKIVHHPLVLAIPTLPLHLAMVLHQDFKVLQASKARLPLNLLSRLVLMGEGRKNKVSLRECQERSAGHQALNRYSMARAGM